MYDRRTAFFAVYLLENVERYTGETSGASRFIKKVRTFHKQGA
jgi:hypothetical protein